MATSELIEALQALAHERKIDEFYLIERLEASLAKSYQHILDLEWDARVTIDRQTGHIYVYELVPVGDPDPETGEYAEFEERDVTPNDVSRIAAQNAKSVISSIVRDAGRQSIYEEFSNRVGDLVTGTVLQGTPDFTIIKIRDGVEAELPHYDVKFNPSERNERPAGEHYRHNQRIKTLIIDVRDNTSGKPAEMADALDYFLPKGDLFLLRDRDGKETTYSSGSSYLNMPMVVLVNENTTCAAEVFACIMQQAGVTIVGRRTPGSAQSQVIVELSDGSAVRLSKFEYLTPDKKSMTDLGGVTPDIASYQIEDSELDVQLEAAKDAMH